MASDWEAEARELLDQSFSRGVVKRYGARLDATPGLRAEVVRLAEARGVVFPEDHPAWPGKRLLRVARAREGAARERSTPIAHDAGFTCIQCGFNTPPLGVTSRDHCPRCLTSLHVDVVPGDRKSNCGGVLQPVQVDQSHGDWKIGYICNACGKTSWCKAVLHGEEPDDWEALMRIAGKGGP